MDNNVRTVMKTFSEITPRRWHRDWGPWRLNKSNYTLEHPNGYYYVDLEQCLTSAQMLDIIMQICRKTWADEACLAGLVRALSELLSPQATLCGSGMSH